MSELLHDRVRYEVQDGVARLTMARPDAGNGLDLAMATALRDAARRAVVDVQDDRARAVLLAAEGRMFCVGGDLRGLAEAEDRATRMAELAAAVHEAIRLLAAAPVPVVTAVGGTAAGGGFGLALSGDVVVASTTATFASAYTAAGLSPDCGTSWYLARRLGSARALDLTLTNRRLTGTEAAAWGLVSRAVDPDALEGEVEALLQGFVSGSRDALARTKRLVRSAELSELGAHLDAEADSIAALAASADGVEGVTAFLEKRRPVFGGTPAR